MAEFHRIEAELIGAAQRANSVMDQAAVDMIKPARLFIKQRLPWLHSQVDAIAPQLAAKMAEGCGFYVFLRDTSETTNFASSLDAVVVVGRNARKLLDSISALDLRALNWVGALLEKPDIAAEKRPPLEYHREVQWLHSLVDFGKLAQKLRRGMGAKRTGRIPDNTDRMTLDYCEACLKPFVVGHEDALPVAAGQLAEVVFEWVTKSPAGQRFRDDRRRKPVQRNTSVRK